MNNATPCVTPAPENKETTESYKPSDWWRNPYLLGIAALITIAGLSILFSLLMVCRRLNHFHYCSLFLVEMAVGSITTEAIVHLIPSLILEKKPRNSSGMPLYFPRLAVVTMSVCILHALDTASVVFFGRRQSTSHAMEWRSVQYTKRNANIGRLAAKHNLPDDDDNAETAADAAKQPVERDEAVIIVNESPRSDSSTDSARQKEGTNEKKLPTTPSTSSSSSASVQFEENPRDKNKEVTLGEAIANPRLCLESGPYRLCSILSAGAVLHSFADGVAIGAAFVKGWESGLHLSLSVGMHELAHKVADFAVLTAMGFSLNAVILLNACYWVSSFLGLLVSVPLSQKSSAVGVWIMTIATGVFVYISLVTMSSMVRKNYSSHHISAFIIGNLGMTTGYLVIMLASVLEFNYA